MISKLLIALMFSVVVASTKADSGDSAELLDRIEVLYNELISFKDTKEFKKFGFAQGGPYHEWVGEAKALNDSSVSMISFVGAYNFVPGDLLQLGMEYVSSKGEETSFTSDSRSILEAAFATK